MDDDDRAFASAQRFETSTAIPILAKRVDPKAPRLPPLLLKLSRPCELPKGNWKRRVGLDRAACFCTRVSSRRWVT